jgi:hypothetical protein
MSTRITVVVADDITPEQLRDSSLALRLQGDQAQRMADPFAARKLAHASQVLRAVGDRLEDARRPLQLRPSHLRVVYLMARRGPMTDQAMMRHYRVRMGAARGYAWESISESGLRTRRSELVRWGFVEPVPDEKGQTTAGNPSTLWRLRTWDESDAAAYPSFAAGDETERAELRDTLDRLDLDAGTDVVLGAELAAFRTAIRAALAEVAA